MIPRRKTRTVQIGSVRLGSGYPIVIQSMTKVFTTDAAACVRQIRRLQEAGCGLVRLAVPTRSDTLALAHIVQKVSIPLIADIHFSAERAVEAVEAGAAKIRLNPGNIKNRRDIFRIIDCAKQHRIAIRIGVNEASAHMLDRFALHDKEHAAFSASAGHLRCDGSVVSSERSILGADGSRTGGPGQI